MGEVLLFLEKFLHRDRWKASNSGFCPFFFRFFEAFFELRFGQRFGQFERHAEVRGLAFGRDHVVGDAFQRQVGDFRSRGFRDATGACVHGDFVDADFGFRRAFRFWVKAGACDGFFVTEIFHCALSHSLGVHAHAGTDVGADVRDDPRRSLVGQFPDGGDLEVGDPPRRVAGCLGVTLFFGFG